MINFWGQTSSRWQPQLISLSSERLPQHTIWALIKIFFLKLQHARRRAICFPSGTSFNKVLVASGQKTVKTFRNTESETFRRASVLRGTKGMQCISRTSTLTSKNENPFSKKRKHCLRENLHPHFVSPLHSHSPSSVPPLASDLLLWDEFVYAASKVHHFSEVTFPLKNWTWSLIYYLHMDEILHAGNSADLINLPYAPGVLRDKKVLLQKKKILWCD